VDIPRIKVGKKQTVETLINEEALLFARFLRGKRVTWIPCITLQVYISKKRNLGEKKILFFEFPTVILVVVF